MRLILVSALVLSFAACGGGGGGGGSSGGGTPPPAARDWSILIGDLTLKDASGNIHADAPLHYVVTPRFSPGGLAGVASPVITVEVLRGASVIKTYTITDALSDTNYHVYIPASDWGATWGSNTIAIVPTVAAEPGYVDSNTANNSVWSVGSYWPLPDGTYAPARAGGLDVHAVVVNTSGALTLTGNYKSRSMNGAATVSGGAFSYSVPLTNLGGIVQYQATVTGTITVQRQMAYTIFYQERFMSVGIGWGSWQTYTDNWTGTVGSGG